jgi:hypothetical protein
MAATELVASTLNCSRLDPARSTSLTAQDPINRSGDRMPEVSESFGRWVIHARDRERSNAF